MTNYTVKFASDAEFASHDFDAETPEQALARAQELYAHELHTDGPSRLCFEPYIDMTMNEIAVCDADGNELAVWYDEDLRLRLAARDLLNALEDLVERDRAEAASCGFTDDEMSWLEDARRAIAKAKGGAASTAPAGSPAQQRRF